ncbi:fibronectin type III domain-containing protein [Gammaproteobacteria bacterium]|nr:fibronectin type III domain-containing protein [Gammaproteobacteria bacterium]
MVNNLKSLELKDFVFTDIPKDVVQVDLLYKDDKSPEIYLIKSIDPSNEAWTAQGSTAGLTGSYKVTTENIYATLPSNQSLRLWDNVPKSSLAQEITGNRVVYGNYTQGYDLETTPVVNVSLDTRKIGEYTANLGQKSVKSLRTYNVGIVYGDKYGRETPVFTSKDANQIVTKDRASLSNMLKAEVDGDHPSWADYYKFFVKETSSEYYNLALGRTYNAEDGNIWLAFPSIDRNKVDEDTYLVLKKGVKNSLSGNEEEVITEEEARYKIVAIENEAPDYIKTVYTTIAKPILYPSVTTDSVFGGHDSPGVQNTAKEPVKGSHSFYIEKNRWIGDSSTTGAFGMPDLHDLWTGKRDSEIYVHFIGDINSKAVQGRKYKVEDVKVILAGSAVSTNLAVYEVFLSSPILASDDWISNTPISGGANLTLDQTSHRPVFSKKEVKNKPEFDGRFFVKIKYDDVAQRNLVAPRSGDIEYTVVANTDLFWFRDGNSEDIIAGQPFSLSASTPSFTDIYSNVISQFGGNTSPMGGNTGQGGTGKGQTGKSQWKNLVGSGKWFVDQVAYAGIQPNNSGDIEDTIVHSDMADMTSNQIYCKNAGCSTGGLFGSGGSTTGNFGTGFSKAARFGEGIATYGNIDTLIPDEFTRTLHLSFSGIDPSMNSGGGWIDDDRNLFGYDYDSWYWKVGDEDNTHEVKHKKFVSMIKEGSKFRISGDTDKIYTIQKVETKRLYNYRAWFPEAYHGIVYSHHANSNWDRRDWTKDWGRPDNRRLQFIIDYTVDGATHDNQWGQANDLRNNLGMLACNSTNSQEIQFLEPYEADKPEPIPTYPPIFETEPKEDLDLDIYYEATGKIPTSINKGGGELLVPIGSTVRSSVQMLTSNPDGFTVTGWGGIWNFAGTYEYNLMSFSPPITLLQFNSIFSYNTVDPIVSFDTPHGDVAYVNIISNNYSSATGTIDAFLVEPVSALGLNWFNCFSFGNGVESNRIGDTFNKPYLLNGAKVSTTLDEKYKKEDRKYGLIYSGIYNSTSGVNGLNQFIAAEKITKDINPIYGSIQKLHSGWGQGGDLVTLCEDRILKILANKDALYNADGNTNVTSTNNVLGQAIPYSGEYGISENPESFASEAYRVYFTDKVRGTIMRLSMDGLTPISNYGMKDWFRDNLKLSNKLVGSYDDKKDEYNITIKGDTIAKTVTFKEDVKGWVSFKSFTPENAISCANEYYTFLDGRAWKHHDETKPRNTFYDHALAPSTLEVVFNEVPGSVKSFKTINYEGSQAKVTSKDENGVTFMDGEYFNLSDVDGWYVENIVTNLEQGGITEFVNKEGKWFGYVTGNDVTHTLNGDVSGNYYTEDFSIQGVGRTISAVSSIVFGCTNPNTYNYNPAANQDDGSCVAIVYGCLDPNAFNYYAGANVDDGTCAYLGCTTGPLADWNNQNAGGSINYDPNANTDDGSCIAAVFGCTDSTMFNYNSLANVGTAILSDGTNCGYENCACVPVTYGCTDPNASNYITPVDEMQDVNTDDGSCIYNGCTDPYADNYGFADPTTAPPGWDGIVGVNIGGSISYVWLNGTAVDDGSCTYPGGCIDSTACNYDSTPGMVDNGSCQYCGDDDAVNYDGAQDTSCTTNCTYCEQPVPLTISAQATSDANMNNGSVTLEWAQSTSATIQYYEITINNGNPINVNPSGNATETHTINNLAPGTYNFQVIAHCTQTSVTGTVSATPIFIQTHITVTPVPGCTDYGQTYYGGVTNPAGGTWGACNFNPAATQDDGSCEYTTCTGCNDPLYVEYCGDCWDTTNQVVVASGESNWVADTIPTSCLTLIVYGCTDATAFNYNSLATVDDGTCVPVVLGCMDSTLTNTGTYAASNYAGPGSNVTPEANTHDGSCLPYNCPIVNINSVNSGGYIDLEFNTSNTIYSKLFVDSNTTPNAKTSLVVLDSLGNSIYSDTNGLGGWGTAGAYTMDKNQYIGAALANHTPAFANGDDITVTFGLTTTDGGCIVQTQETYSIGCTDPLANSYDLNYDITYNSQCVYSGCTDNTPAVMNWNAGASTNYDPNATISCGTNNDNECCTYHDDQDIEAVVVGSASYPMVRLTYEPESTGYTEAVFSSLTLGEAPGTVVTTNNQYPKSNMTLSIGTRLAVMLTPTVWETYVYNNQLKITANAEFNGACDNNFLNDQLPTGSVNKTFNFSVGCKDDNTAINYDQNVDLGMASTCIAANPGCMDSTADNYNAAFNQDCTFDGSANPNDCCCYTCGIPTFEATNPVVVNTWNDPLNPTIATQTTFNFAAVSTAVSYTIFVDGGSTAIIPVVSPTINNGIVSYTYSDNFSPLQNESTYDFKVRAICKNNDGDFCGSSDSAEITIQLLN